VSTFEQHFKRSYDGQVGGQSKLRKKLSSLLSKIEAKIADFVKQTAEHTE
jgi:hypothetical protein